MGLSGQWKTRQGVPYTGPMKNGTGWNAVHNTHGGSGRGTATHETLDTIAPSEVDEFQPTGYDYEADVTSTLFGDNADHPNWGATAPRMSVPSGYPSPGATSSGIPAGTQIRAVDKGADTTNYMKAQQPPSLLSDGYKRSGAVENATVSDPDQYVMQTSMRQRDQTRTGSQASGRANAPRASIRSRIPGMRIPTYSEGYRHAEMTPKGQDVIIRPFANRTAATGDPNNMDSNGLYEAVPHTREPVPLPFTGEQVGLGYTVTDTDYGYTDEDSSYV